MIRILTLYVVPISFAIILIIGLVGNTLVIFVVSSVILVAISIDNCIEVKKITLDLLLILNLVVNMILSKPSLP